jgi:hypothetical protein
VHEFTQVHEFAQVHDFVQVHEFAQVHELHGLRGDSKLEARSSTQNKVNNIHFSFFFLSLNTV